MHRIKHVYFLSTKSNLEGRIQRGHGGTFYLASSHVHQAPIRYFPFAHSPLIRLVNRPQNKYYQRFLHTFFGLHVATVGLEVK